jgi:DNA-binding NtrC family response regulator
VKRILIVDDDPVHLKLTSGILSKADFEPVTAASGEKALEILAKDPAIAGVVLDLVMPGLDGFGVLEAMRREAMRQPVIVQTAKSSPDIIVSAMRAGAADYVVKPADPDRLVTSLNNMLRLSALSTALEIERTRREGRFGFDDIITQSPAMKRVIELGRKAAASTIPVLIEGESGAGKELIARAIQGEGDRARKPFVTVNCGAIPAELIESTLFGHVKGAFTGADSNHKGKFAEAHGGTLFLDEIGELPPAAQVKLLRALQDGEIEPVGSDTARSVNVRVISATNRRLLNLAATGAFREDLYYRLNVFPIYLPPLRDRREDVGLLVDHFIARLSAEENRRIDGCTPEARNMLARYDWPGNIRQLQNAVYRAIVLTNGTRLVPEDFPQLLNALEGPDAARAAAERAPAPGAPVHIDATQPAKDVSPATVSETDVRDRFTRDDGTVAPLVEIERDLIAFALDQHDGKMAAVARALGIGRSTLYRKLKDYGLDNPNEDAA